jgi:pimeloyl-ACP methyl ester carboxylesterase
MELKEWANKGTMVSVLGHDVFIIDEGKSENTLIILHGYGTSSLDYYKILPELTEKYRVIIQDFVGFGFSDKPFEYYFNILEQADVTLELWRILGLKKITLLGHNYGNQIGIEILTRLRTQLTKIEIEKVIFLNSTLSFNHTNATKESLQPLQEFSKIKRLMSTSFSFYKMKIKEFYFDKSKISDLEINANWTLLHHNNGREVVDFLYDYNTESKLLWKRWFQYIQKNTIPARIISGKNDTVFNEKEAIHFSEELNNSTLSFIENCGHYPMLEKPKELVNLLLNV